MKHWIFIFCFSLFIAACATKEKTSDVDVLGQDREERVGTELPDERVPSEPAVDPDDVLRVLKVNLHTLPLGYKQYNVDLCKSGLSKYDCGRKYFTVVKFRITCRDSEGTVEYVTGFEPFAGKSVQWRVLNQQGRTSTGPRGEGTAYFLTSYDPKSSRFALIYGRHSLGLRVNQVRSVVVPSYWCD